MSTQEKIEELLGVISGHTRTHAHIKMLGAIAAYITGYKPWAPNYDHLMTMVDWQGGPTINGIDNSWIPFYKPITANYEPDHIGNEITILVLILGLAIWGYLNRNHKVDAVFARTVMGLCIASAVYMCLIWIARQHVEGDWTAVPPRLMKHEVDTPEFLAKEAALKAEWQQLEYKRLGLTPTGEKIWHKVCIYY